jgi:hypothetical protein
MNEMPIPVIRSKGDYDAFLAIPTTDLPKTFDEWQKGMAREREQFLRTGATLVSIEIHPDEFANFCTQRGIPANFEAIKRFTLEKYSIKNNP